MKNPDGHTENNGESIPGFYDLFGMKASYREIQEVARELKSLGIKISERSQAHSSKEVVIEGVTPEQQSIVEDLLQALKVYPWTEVESDGSVTFTVDNKREVQRLQFFSVIKESGEEESLAVPETLTVAESIVSNMPDEYVFPLSPTAPKAESKVVYGRTANIPKTAHSDELPEVDLRFQQMRDAFDKGLPIDSDDSDEVVTANSRAVDLHLFKNRYHYSKDVITAPDGTELSWEEHKDIILGAKDDPEKMEQAVNMSVGLVKKVVDRILDKFGTNEVYNADDLFQVGMEGLLYGLSHIEERENSKPVSYLVPCIEGTIRRFVRQQKPIFIRKHGVADVVVKYRKAQRQLEQRDPHFLNLPAWEQAIKIAETSQLPLSKIREAQDAVTALKVSFDEEAINPDLFESDDPMTHAEQLDLKKSFEEVLPKLSIREELILRLRFGILGKSRFSDPEILAEYLEEMKGHDQKWDKTSSLHKLTEFDLSTDDHTIYNPAEQLFLALIGKIPASFVEHLLDGAHGGSDVTLEDIGKLFDVTRDRIRQIEARALRRLKHPSRSTQLRAHLD